MRNRRSIGKLEAKKARNYCYQNSIREGIDDSDIAKETIFLGTFDQLKEAVLAEVRETREGLIPEIPQGTVITDIHGVSQIDDQHLGAF